MKERLVSKFAATVAIIGLVAAPLNAEKANQLGTLRGLDAWGAEQALQSRGFQNISSHKNTRGDVNSYWWDGGDKNCVRVTVNNDTVQSIVDAKHKDCNHSNGNTAAAAGVVAGLAILGALAASKSHHSEGRDYSQQEQGEFDRGYRDGLYNAAYHNSNRSDAYSHGYENGVDERAANLRDHTGHGGYNNATSFADLVGSRASGGMNELERRGFRQVDNFASGNARYSIQYREASRQCIQVITSNGRLEDISDIRTHPKCRGGGGAASSLPSNWYQRLPGAANDFAESELSKANFRQVDKFDTGSSGHGYVWYNRSSRQCLQVITSHGRVESAVDIQTHRRCR